MMSLVRTKGVTLLVASTMLLASCSDPVSDLAEQACGELEGLAFLPAYAALIDYLDELRLLDIDVDEPDVQTDVRAELRETEFWDQLSAKCSPVVEQLDKGPSRAELESVLAGLIDAHKSLTDFRNQIASGLTYGGLRDTWPPIAASAQRGVTDSLEALRALPAGMPQADARDAIDYATAVSDLLGGWQDVHDAVSGYLRQTRTESSVSDAIEKVLEREAKAEKARDAALTPGPG